MDDIPTENEIQLAEIIWEYMKMKHNINKSDIILCLGSYDIRVAEKAASLWLQGFGDWLMFSGNTGKLTKSVWKNPEAVVFAERARSMGVPDENIIIESKSTNTGENIRFSFDVLKERGINPRSFIIVQKPYMERRAYATFMKQWPDDTSQLHVFVTSPELGLRNYPSNTTGALKDVISVLVGDFARIKLYEEKGFQIHQHVPHNVETAFQMLAASGKYISHMPS